MLLFSDVANVFSEIEQRSGRIEMTGILAELFKKTGSEEIDKLVYLLQGILAPPYDGIELGLGEQFAIRAIATASGYSKSEVEKRYVKSGDLGLTAEELLTKKKQQSLTFKDMDVIYIYNAFVKIAKSSGTGSQEMKIKLLTELLNNANPLEARFIVRFVIGELRLGIGDPTILDALSTYKTGDKSLRESLERAYNICADMGHVSKVFFETPERIDSFKVQPFKPLMPALAERLPSPEEIVEKLGECAVEPKFDGLRLQCHKKGEKVYIYSRKLEDLTHMFPDLVEAIKKLKEKEIIFEGEALAFNVKKKRYFSFQETMHRRRKHGIEEASKEFPINLFVFDILFVDREDFTQKPYKERRAKLEKIFPKGPLKSSECTIIKKPEQLEKLFAEYTGENLEGIMAKDLNSPYTAGKRKFAWIKLKKSYGTSMDTIEAVIVGFYRGKGSRAEFKFGGLLVAVCNPDENKFETIAKIGSGFTEEEMQFLEKELSKIKTPKPPADLSYKLEADVWVKPKYVVEIAFDEITVSPIHTCGEKDGKGLALRFPRLVKMREDRSPKQATTTKEVSEMYWMTHKK